MDPERFILCICGPPFAGKSTAAQDVSDRYGWDVITADEIGRTVLARKPKLLDEEDPSAAAQKKKKAAANAPAKAEPEKERGEDEDEEEKAADEADKKKTEEPPADEEDDDDANAWLDFPDERLPYPKAARVDCEQPDAFLTALVRLFRSRTRSLIIDGIRGHETLKRLKMNGGIPVRVICVQAPFEVRESRFEAHAGRNGTPYALIADYAIESDQAALPFEADACISNSGTIAEFRERLASSIRADGRVTPPAIFPGVPDKKSDAHTENGPNPDIPQPAAGVKKSLCPNCSNPHTEKKYFSKKRKTTVCERCYDAEKDDEADFESCDFCGSYEFRIVTRLGGSMCRRCFHGPSNRRH
jgi:dephospho-CoA kinase